jgi:hypothetical protein
MTTEATNSLIPSWVHTTEALVKHWATFIKAHEKLILAIIIAFVAIHYADKGYNAYGNYLKSKTTADNAQIAQLQKQNESTQAKLNEMVAEFKVQSALDELKIAKAKQTVVIKQKEDAALPLPDLSKRWEEILVLPSGSITPQSNGTVAVSTDAAHTTVSELEKVGPLTDQYLAGCRDAVDVR